jgi:hypothetical protein
VKFTNEQTYTPEGFVVLERYPPDIKEVPRLIEHYAEKW